MSQSIGIIGLGHVGNVMLSLFEKHANIVTYDPLMKDKYPYEELAKCSLGIVCVGTPTRPDGSCDVSNVREAVSRVPIKKILLKSTVSPGTTDELAAETGKEICFSPEYVGETTFYNPLWDGGARRIPFVIVGGPAPIRSAVIDLLLSILGPTPTYFQCSALEAELIKYMENAFLATKVTFVSEFNRICRTFGADWNMVREGWLLDPRIGRSHTAVFSGAPGFSGKCLPKDLSAIVNSSVAAGYIPEFLQEVLRSNSKFKEEEAGKTHTAQ